MGFCQPLSNSCRTRVKSLSNLCRTRSQVAEFLPSVCRTIVERDNAMFWAAPDILDFAKNLTTRLRKPRKQTKVKPQCVPGNRSPGTVPYVNNTPTHAQKQRNIDKLSFTLTTRRLETPQGCVQFFKTICAMTFAVHQPPSPRPLADSWQSFL